VIPPTYTEEIPGRTWMRLEGGVLFVATKHMDLFSFYGQTKMSNDRQSPILTARIDGLSEIDQHTIEDCEVLVLGALDKMKPQTM
jgi:hypothetical protein